MNEDIFIAVQYNNNTVYIQRNEVTLMFSILPDYSSQDYYAKKFHKKDLNPVSKGNKWICVVGLETKIGKRIKMLSLIINHTISNNMMKNNRRIMTEFLFLLLFSISFNHHSIQVRIPWKLQNHDSIRFHSKHKSILEKCNNLVELCYQYNGLLT